MQLYGLTTSGKIKTLIIETKGAKLISSSGQLGGAMTTTEKTCIGMNIGKGNETTPAEQAILEMNAKVKKKTEQGYSLEMPVAGTSVKNAVINLSELPSSFCPSKPISKCPTKVEKNPNTFAQRKRNGNCLILTKTVNEERVFSRGMKELTNTMNQIPEVKALFAAMSPGDMINSEFVFVKNSGKESTAQVGSIVRTKNPSEVMEKYNEALTKGKFELVAFDILFHNDEFVGDLDYLDERYLLLKETGYDNIPDNYWNWRELCEKAEEDVWEGWVLRVHGDSAVTYTLNGKADRAGAYKWVFKKIGDFVVSEVKLGESGFHATVYSTFKIGQYEDGVLLDCGWAGPGKLTQEELTQYDAEIRNGKLPIPFVVEIMFRAWQDDSTKLEHPVIQRVRFDKEVNDCQYEG